MKVLSPQRNALSLFCDKHCALRAKINSKIDQTRDRERFDSDFNVVNICRSANVEIRLNGQNDFGSDLIDIRFVDICITSSVFQTNMHMIDIFEMHC